MAKNPKLDLSCLDEDDEPMGDTDAAEKAVVEGMEIKKIARQDKGSEKVTEQVTGLEKIAEQSDGVDREIEMAAEVKGSACLPFIPNSVIY